MTWVVLLGMNLALGQVHIELESVPESTPKDATIFISGNLNHWNPANRSYALNKSFDGKYYVTLDSAPDNLEFKFTRGSWDAVEGDVLGRNIPNRVFFVKQPDTLVLDVDSWEDLDGGGIIESTANEQVITWDSAMWIPQLKRSRLIRVYLPKDYYNSSKRYQVIYMLDGQNVFDMTTSYAGEWKVDETLSKLEQEGKRSAIVVAIDNGGPLRISEYSPYPNEKFGVDEGHEFVRFLVETLKPKVDQTFRTKRDAANTAIVGSSLGALIAHYAYFKYPTVFSKVGIFSPSYWFLPEFFDLTIHPKSKVNPRIYMLAGEHEEGMIDRTKEMYQRLLDGGFDTNEVVLDIDPDGTHSEAFWSRKFEEAFMWLFEETEKP